MNRQAFRTLFLATAVLAMIAVLLLSAWLFLWPMWLDDRARQELAKLIDDGEYTVLGPNQEALRRFRGKAAVPVLTKALADDHKEIRNRSVALLGLIGPDAEAAVPAIRERLSDSDALVRIHAAEALWQICRDDEARFLLFQWLEEEESFFRGAVVGALGTVGADAKDAIPDLLRMREEAGPFERSFYDKAIAKIDPNALKQ